MTKRYKFIKKGRFHGTGKNRYSARLKQALINYQGDPEECGRRCRDTIVDYLIQQRYVTRTVYRGQQNTEIYDSDFFSCSSDYKTVIEEGFVQNGYMFVIHLKNVPVIDMNQTLGESSLYPEQLEFIVLGNGKFYKDEDLTESGFVESNINGIRVFTAYYDVSDVDIKKIVQLD